MSLQELFPGLTADNHHITSPASTAYNCIAWAAGDDTTRWDPAPHFYWPRRVPRNTRLDSLVEMFMKLGYADCPDGAFEKGKEKIAICSLDASTFSHVARQFEDGMWTSKLGLLEDITHTDCECLEGDEYGKVVRWMVRSRESS